MSRTSTRETVNEPATTEEKSRASTRLPDPPNERFPMVERVDKDVENQGEKVILDTPKDTLNEVLHVRMTLRGFPTKCSILTISPTGRLRRGRSTGPRKLHVCPEMGYHAYSLVFLTHYRSVFLSFFND